MYKAVQSRSDVDRLYASRTEGRRGLASTDDRVDAVIQPLEDYIKWAKKYWLHWPETTQTTQGSTDQK